MQGIFIEKDYDQEWTDYGLSKDIEFNEMKNRTANRSQYIETISKYLVNGFGDRLNQNKYESREKATHKFLNMYERIYTKHSVHNTIRDNFLCYEDSIIDYSFGETLIDYQHKFIESIYPHEFSDTDSHTHEVGGEEGMEMRSIVNKFYEDTNIQSIYVHEENQDINLVLILTDNTVKQLALKLAKIQNQVSREHPKLNIEIKYIPAKYFTEDYIPDGAVPFPRR